MSSSPDSVKGVGAMGNIPVNVVDLALEFEEITRIFPCLDSVTSGLAGDSTRPAEIRTGPTPSACDPARCRSRCACGRAHRAGARSAASRPNVGRAGLLLAQILMDEGDRHAAL